MYRVCKAEQADYGCNANQSVGDPRQDRTTQTIVVKFIGVLVSTDKAEQLTIVVTCAKAVGSENLKYL